MNLDEMPKGDGRLDHNIKNYKTNPPKYEDPLVVGTDRYGKYPQDEAMLPIDVLEEQKYGQKDDQGKNFIPIDQVHDPEANHFDEKIDLDDSGKYHDYKKDKEPSQERDIKEVLINGIPLVDIVNGKISNKELSQEVVRNYQEKNIQKISVNRGKKTNSDIVQYGKKGQPHKIKRQVRSIASKISKKHKKTPWQGWPTSNHSSNGTERASSNLHKKDLNKAFKHGKDLGDYTKTA